MNTYDDGDLYDFEDLEDYDLHFFHKSKTFRKVTKNLNAVKKITDNPIVRGVINVIPYGGTALTALDSATALANKVNKGDRKAILTDPTVKAGLAMVPGGSMLTNTLGMLEASDRANRNRTRSIRVRRKGKARIIADEIQEELQKRKFMPSRNPRNMVGHIKTLKGMKKAQAVADAYDADEYYQEPAEHEYVELD